MVFAQIPPEALVFRGHVQHLLGFRLSRVTVILVQSALFAGAVSLVVDPPTRSSTSSSSVSSPDCRARPPAGPGPGWACAWR